MWGYWFGPGLHRRRRHRMGVFACGPWGGFGFGPGPWMGMGYRSKRELIRELEEYQKDLEQEIADVADRIRELKEELGED